MYISHIRIMGMLQYESTDMATAWRISLSILSVGEEIHMVDNL